MAAKLSMYNTLVYYVHMTKRTTIEIDEQLLARAKRALGRPTTRATVEEALRRAAEQAEDEHEERAARQREYFALLATLGRYGGAGVGRDVAVNGWIVDKSAAARATDPVIGAQLAQLAGSLSVCADGGARAALLRPVGAGV